MSDSLLGLDAKSLFGEETRQRKQDVRILDNKIIIISKEALFVLIKTGWYWEAKPSDDRIDRIVDAIEEGRLVDLKYDFGKISKNKIISGLEKAMNGTWTYDKKFSFTTPDHIKECFVAFLNNKDFNDGKAELLMKIILWGHLRDIRELTENGLLEVERWREKQAMDEKKRETAKVIEAEPEKSNSGSNVFRKNLEKLIYFIKNEWNPKYIGGRLEITQHGRKYRVTAYSTTDNDTMIVWDSAHYVVKYADWKGNSIWLSSGFGSWTLYGPRGWNND